jgi:DNA repair protein RecN (Recombination protein N)
VLERLYIVDFAVARSVEVCPGPGLNAFTGETGAGKSLIVDALAFVCGARRGRDVIATGAAKAVVTATLTLDGVGHVLERSVGLSGRSSATIDGILRSAVQILELGAAAAEIHGQSDQLAILRPSEQLLVLDAFAGLGAQRERVALVVRNLREVRRRIESLSTDSRERERLLEQLTFETSEIGAATLVEGEDETLRTERSRLSSVRHLRESTARALEGLDASALGEVARAVAEIGACDSSAPGLTDLAVLLESTAADLSRELRRYAEALEDDPERLSELDERLDLLARLRRKYGESIGDIIAYSIEANARIAGLSGAGASVEELRRKESDLLEALAGEAAELSKLRRAAAGRLVTSVGDELGHLGMGGGALAIGFAAEDDAAGPLVNIPDFDVIACESEPPAEVEAARRAFTETGVDHVEFLASFNPGESPRPLGAVASGGETSRFLLALTTVLGDASSPRTIVLDEVDEGVGGRSGALVGDALARLAQRHQVLVVTHLPQVAAFARRHFVVRKESDGSRTWSEIHEVKGEQRVDELASMLGGITPATQEAARELLARSGDAR